ncbi:ATP-dependent DNA helicase, partial [Caligus rogercresseyi]
WSQALPDILRWVHCIISSSSHLPYTLPLRNSHISGHVRRLDMADKSPFLKGLPGALFIVWSKPGSEELAPFRITGRLGHWVIA